MIIGLHLMQTHNLAVAVLTRVSQIQTLSRIMREEDEKRTVLFIVPNTVIVMLFQIKPEFGFMKEYSSLISDW